MKTFRMTFFRTLITLTLACCLALPRPQTADAHGGERPEKKGVLLVAFGTSVKGADEAYRHIEELARLALPGVDVRMAWSSRFIRRKLDGEHLPHPPSPAEALARMMEEDFTHVAVQSLQTVPGEEFDDVRETARRFSGMPKGMALVETGAPLLSSPEDLERVADALIASLPKERKADQAVVLVGHGTKHPANVYYAGLQYALWKRDGMVFVGTVEGSPTRDDVLRELKVKGVKKVWLMPLLAVAGDHAHNDMTGDNPDSWTSVLGKAGIECVPVLKGTGDNDALAAIWVDHLKAAFARLK